MLKVGGYVIIEWGILEPKGNKLENPSKWLDTHSMHLVAIFNVFNVCKFLIVASIRLREPPPRSLMLGVKS